MAEDIWEQIESVLSKTEQRALYEDTLNKGDWEQAHNIILDAGLKMAEASKKLIANQQGLIEIQDKIIKNQTLLTNMAKEMTEFIEDNNLQEMFNQWLKSRKGGNAYEK